MVDRKTTGPITIERQWFIDSRQGNIKDDYYFEKKLGSGGYGAVYLAKHKKTGKYHDKSVVKPFFNRKRLYLESSIGRLGDTSQSL
jgi:hypothetical protein